MNLRSRILAALIFGIVALPGQDTGQAFRQAPLGVEEALKARVMEFYGLLQQGRFRQTESFVCEDSKDFYYGTEKTRHRGGKYMRATFESDYRSAKVQVDLDMDIHTPKGPFPVKYPILSHWRVESGSWCYFVPKETQEYLITPFGKVKRSDPNSQGSIAQLGIPADLDSFKAAVKASSQELSMPSHLESTKEVTFSNSLPGPVELAYDAPPVPGLSVTLDKKVLQSKESATARVSYQPKPGTVLPSITIQFRVNPSGQKIPVRIVFEAKPPV